MLQAGPDAMAQNEPVRRKPTNAEIPDKLYFRIGDVAKVCDVPAYVLRFWETEFPQLKPNKGGTGQRLYRRRDVETALRIKRLLYDEGYTIPGARQLLKSEQRHTPEPQLALAIESPNGAPALDPRRAQRLERLRKDLEALHTLLSRPAEVSTPASVHTMKSTRAPRTSMPSAVTAFPGRPPMDDLFSFQPTLVPAPDPGSD